MQNKVPPLIISGIPEGTKSLSLIMDDPDAMGAVGKVWVHWVAMEHRVPTTAFNRAESMGENQFSSMSRE